ncbi:hypothetical protein PHYC_00015 [Phycisphaerales bacterium]|nr:hypothetical protein PHYC_00015 [Phycisphaerales bacterium]
MVLRSSIVFSVALAGAPALATAQPDPSGIDFVTIGAPGNTPVDSSFVPPDQDPRVIGRGGVVYEYRIGRFEVTTQQWCDFFNAAFDRPADDRLPHLIPPTFWGAVSTTPNTPGGLRWRVPAGNEMLPTGNISWRMAAMYCNWLTNDRGNGREAFLDGAYDVSTFGLAPIGYTDQLTHHPGARYWIPSWDEWLKAGHYDPSKLNPDGSVGGWWRCGNTSDVQPPYGPPGVRVRASGLPGPDPDGPLAQANAGWDNITFPGYSPFSVPLGAYPTVQSPWGLFDIAGGTTEWTEEALLTSGIWPTARLFDGSYWTGGRGLDLLNAWGGDYPGWSTFDFGFRVASAVPSPGFSALGVALLFSWHPRRRHGGSHAMDRDDRLMLRSRRMARGEC